MLAKKHGRLAELKMHCHRYLVNFRVNKSLYGSNEIEKGTKNNRVF